MDVAENRPSSKPERDSLHPINPMRLTYLSILALMLVLFVGICFWAYSGKRKDAYVYGTMRESGWKPKKEKNPQSDGTYET